MLSRYSPVPTTALHGRPSRTEPAGRVGDGSLALRVVLAVVTEQLFHLGDVTSAREHILDSVTIEHKAVSRKLENGALPRCALPKVER